MPHYRRNMLLQQQEPEFFFLNILQDHPFNTYTKFFKTLLFLTPYYAPVGVSIWGSEILVFRKILRMYNMDDLRIEYSTH